ncbi:E3 ubiquitin-protein ligase RING1-like [Alnus glutinosa]|uniref:E3 ubiquitin-protein ligase RING1-like n=1 Tax=Alnus glutinosa TaxID=3517 RepID=UPI002D76AE19|nr:E3 ubiquitin-protein ligase RING1-like [Alnus glutinosa]XP_062150912.1 E3 ubiquitin-protein ligase RING1-like [Alnus glutinosa]XP_062150913.1 E3 ubiquitin-protein ligase RING1-like [Alnus glutinosa]XP_062150914.1 E3 ubiquitin-protein ligase RING1-like [Alnus glutinosa]
MSQLNQHTLPETDPNPLHPHIHTQSLDSHTHRRSNFHDNLGLDPFAADSDQFSDSGSGSDRDVDRLVAVLLERLSDDDLLAFHVDTFPGLLDEYGVIGPENGDVLGRFAENQRRSRPAAKRVVESLPCVELTVEELGRSTAVCAVCKDEIVVEEKVRRLPCAHYYHGDCIVPWLSIRNTCPLCRYELPTEEP